MNIHEYQSKEIFKKIGINVQNGVDIFSLHEIDQNFKKLKMVNTKGFAGISIFKKKTGLKKGRLFKE